VKCSELILTVVVPLAGCKDVNGSELMLTVVVLLAGCKDVNGSELVVPISINVVAEPLRSST
jgi:hypothetical protein